MKNRFSRIAELTIILLLILSFSAGCSKVNNYNGSESSNNYEAPVYSEEPNSESSNEAEHKDIKPSESTDNSSSDSKASVVIGILISDKLLEDFRRERLSYTIIVDDDVTSPPTVAALKSNGTGELRIVQATGINGTATVTLNGITYSIKFSKAEKPQMLQNTYFKLKRKQKLRVAYFGGSITFGFGSKNHNEYSWRALTTSWLKRNFPAAAIEETNAAIGGTGTAFGIYRAVSDMKLDSEAEKPDLVFLEFAINDLYDGTDVNTAKSNVEYIIRTIYQYSPDADIIMVLTTDQACMNKDYKMLVAHREVANAYKIPYICVGKMLWNEMLSENNGKYPTAEIYSKYFYDTVHPADKGYAKYAEYITSYIDVAFSEKTAVPANSENSYIPDSPINVMPVSPYSANFAGQSAPAGFVVDKNGYITSDNAGSTFSFTFTGTDLKLWQWTTPQSGSITVSIDGASEKTIDLYRASTNHAIRPVASGLENKSHTVTVTLNSTSHGSHMDIRYFLISGSESHSGLVFK